MLRIKRTKSVAISESHPKALSFSSNGDSSQNLMKTLKNLGQSMLKHIQVTSQFSYSSCVSTVTSIIKKTVKWIIELVKMFFRMVLTVTSMVVSDGNYSFPPYKLKCSDDFSLSYFQAIELVFQQEPSLVQAGLIGNLAKTNMIEKGQVKAITALKEFRKLQENMDLATTFSD